MTDSMRTVTTEYWNQGWQNDEEPPEAVLDNKAVPFLLPYLSTSDILNCRCVSKSWNDQVDKFLSEDNVLLRPYSYEQYESLHYNALSSNSLVLENHSLKEVREAYKFHKVRTMSNFTRNMVGHLSTIKNPFIGRFISVGCPMPKADVDPTVVYPDINEYWVHLEKFLRQWGTHIWHLRLTDDSQHKSADELYFLLLQLVRHLPNLKLLDIPSIRLSNYSEKSLSTLRQTIEDNPFPLLSNLDSILLPRVFASLPEDIQQTLIRTHARQLRKIRLGVANLPEDYPHLLTNLSEITCFNVLTNENISNTVGVFTAPLEKLTLDLRGMTVQHCWSVETILSVLQDIPLKTFVLKLEDKVPLVQTRTPSNLPIRGQFKVESLKTLEMNHVPNTSYNFLWCLPALKHLHIEYNPYIKGDLKGNLMKIITGGGTDVGEEDQELDIRYLMEHGGDLYTSNIWHVLSKLQVFSYSHSSFLWGPKLTVYERQILEKKREAAKKAAVGEVKEEDEVKTKPSPPRVVRKSLEKLDIAEAFVYHSDKKQEKRVKRKSKGNAARRSLKLTRL